LALDFEADVEPVFDESDFDASVDADGEDVAVRSVLTVFAAVWTGAGEGTVVTTTFAAAVGWDTGSATTADAATSADDSAVTDPAACVGGGAAASAAFAE
jgi:hypothetical protein